MDERHVLGQLRQALEGEVFALNGDEHLGGCGHRIHRKETQRRGTIDQHKVVVVLDRIDRHLESHLTTESRNQFDFGSRQVQAGRGHKQIPDHGAFNAVLEGNVVEDHVIHRGLKGPDIDPQAR